MDAKGLTGFVPPISINLVFASRQRVPAITSAMAILIAGWIVFAETVRARKWFVTAISTVEEENAVVKGFANGAIDQSVMQKPRLFRGFFVVAADQIYFGPPSTLTTQVIVCPDERPLRTVI